MDDDRIRWVPTNKPPNELISVQQARQLLLEREPRFALVVSVGDPPTIGYRGEFVNMVRGGRILKAELSERAELAKVEATRASASDWIIKRLGSGQSKFYRVEKRNPSAPISGPLVIEETLPESWRSSERDRRFLQQLILDREGDPSGRWFYAIDGAGLRSALRSAAHKGGRPPAPYWAQAEKAAMSWLNENGYPQLGDGGQAELEEHVAEVLAAEDHYPGESTVRKHVSQWIAQYKQSVNG